MSVRNNCSVISVCDGLTGRVLGTFSLATYDLPCLNEIIKCLFERYVMLDQHGLIIKIGSSDI